MSDRDARIAAFLRDAGWAGATRAPLAGDASNRRYERLHKSGDGARAVLMDAAPERGEDVGPFLQIAAHLAQNGLSPPDILAQDPEAGLLLLEDLGDDLFARLVQDGRAKETPLYAAAVDALAALHACALPPDVPGYGPEDLLRTAGLAYDWYLAGIRGDLRLADKVRFATTLAPLLVAHVSDQSVLVLRDYHAENLIWLPERKGVARVGLLDFQDAAAGHPAYDLVSLLKDARRDVPRSVERDMIGRFLAVTGTDPTAFATAYAVLGAQRNLRILGVFARLSLLHGKPQYVDLIPRVWDHMMTSLGHRTLTPLAARIREDLPEPTPRNLQILKDKCATARTP